MNVNYDESNRFLGMLAEVAVKTLNAEQQKHSIYKIEEKSPKKVCIESLFLKILF